MPTPAFLGTISAPAVVPALRPAGAVRPALPHGQAQFGLPPIAPAGQVAEVALGAAVVGGLALAGWLAYKQFGTHQPAFQPHTTSTLTLGSDLVVGPDTISLMQAQLHWIGTHPVPPLGNILDPTVLTTSLSPASLAVYAAVPINGQFDAPTLLAIANVEQDYFLNNDPNNLLSTATAQSDPLASVRAAAATPAGQQGLINDVDEFYQEWVGLTNAAAAPAAPKPAGQAIVPVGAPAGAFGADALGQCVDVAGNVLSASGASLGGGNVARAGAAMCATALATAPAPTPDAAPGLAAFGSPALPGAGPGAPSVTGIVLVAGAAVAALGLIAYLVVSGREAASAPPAPARRTPTRRLATQRAAA